MFFKIGDKMEKVLGAFIWLKANLQQPSTMASLAIMCQTVGIQLDEDSIQNVLNVATLFFGLLGFFFQEAKPAVKE